MDIRFENVNDNRVHATAGPQLRFDIDDAGQAAVRVVLTIDDGIHVTFPSRSGGAVQSVRTLEPGVHPASVVIAAHDLQGGRGYDTTISINGVPVVRAQGQLPDGSADDSQIRLFQLRVD